MDDFDDLLGTTSVDAAENNLRLALKLASQGFPVFPCREVAETIKGKLRKEKSPATKNGFKDATTDEKKIRAWWSKRPYALVGMPTGKASGLAVIDLDRHDPKADGVKAIKEMGHKIEDLTPLRVNTAGNGIHLLFKWREGITNADKHLPKGIDVRAEGGFIIAPGTRFQDGRMWSEVDLLQKTPDFPEEFMPPPEVDRGAGETGDNHRLDLSLEEIEDYLDDLPNDDDVGRHEWIAIMASLHHEATAPNEDGELRSKADQQAICKLALAWTAKNKTYGTEEHLRQAKQDFWSFRTNPHKKLATFRSIAKQVGGIRQERALDEALGDFEDQDDLGEEPDFTDEDGFEDQEDDDFDDLLGTPAPKKTKKKANVSRETWDDPTAPKYIRLLNKRHALVRFNAKNYIVDFAEKGADEIINLGDEKSLHMTYAPNTVEITVTDEAGKEKTKEVTWSQLWMKSEHRRFYPHGITFNPKEDEKGKLNLWRGFSVEPDPRGRCDLLIKHIEKVLCGGNLAYAKVFLDFLAHMIQRPWERPTFSIVMRGEMGAGKDTPFRYLGEILGPHYITVGRNSDISGRFNSHLMGKVLVHLQEGFYAGDRQQQNYMKFLLDSPKINIERKGVDIFSTKAYHRTVISSNEDWVAPVAWGERRYFILDVDNTYAYGSSDESQGRNKKYFEAIDQQMRQQGGLGKFLDFLMTRDISGFDTRRPPKTEALARQLAEGFRDVDRWWKECLDAGNIEASDGSSDTVMREVWERGDITKPTDDLFDAYDRWRQRQRHRGEAVSRTKFARDMRRLCTHLINKQLIIGEKGVRTRVTILPDLRTCRKDMERLAGGPLDWADEVVDEVVSREVEDDLG